MVDCIENGGAGTVSWLISLPSIKYNGASSSHPGPGGVPTGGNFLYEDTRVEWIGFNGNTNKIAPSARSTAGIYYCTPVKNGLGPW
jgi:hypothetical protein